MLLVFFLWATFLPLSLGQITLPAFNIDKDSVTVSGFSSGAFFATQFHVAFSRDVHGSGTWAGIPYTCFSEHTLSCGGNPSIVNVDALIGNTESLAIDGKIDLPSNLADDRVYIFHGVEDESVFIEAADKLWEYWSHYIPDSSQIVINDNLLASHGVVSDHVGTSCGITDNEIYLENCDFNSVYIVLNHLFGDDLNAPNAPGVTEGRLLEFDQDEFFDGDANGASMDTSGYVYIPSACESGDTQCRLHIFFHGCTQMAENIGTRFLATAGFFEVADANNIVIIFPQTIAQPLNQSGCYNWYGYLNDLRFMEYATKDGRQMAGAYNILRRAAGLE